MQDFNQIERNFREIAPALNEAEAMFEANRCLYCYDAPCTRACPTHIDVPSFIKKIASGNLTGSARVISTRIRLARRARVSVRLMCCAKARASKKL